MKLNKYAVYYKNRGMEETFVHIFAFTQAEAVAFVVNEGVGFDGRYRVYPDSITGVKKV